jgi:carbamoyltransferase
MFLLGISAMEHDPAAVLLDDGKIVAAIEEGKLARTRTLEGIPRAAIQYCLSRAGIGWRDIGRVAVATRPMHACFRQSLFRAKYLPVAPVSCAYYLNKAFGELGRELNNLRILREIAGPPAHRVEELDHHLCHAASAFYASPFDRALILSLDEKGDGRAGFVGLGEGREIREIQSISIPHSLAWVYSQVTGLLGFRPHADEHKTQWLSLQGEPVFANLFLDLLRSHSSGPPHLNSKYFRTGFAGVVAFSDECYRQLNLPKGPERKIEDAMRANIAASFQQACATLLNEWLESLRKSTRAQSLCLAGGLFLNPLLVAVVDRTSGFDQIFVQPAAGNEGTSLGAAWVSWHRDSKNPRVAPMASPHWGPSYSNEEIKKVLDNCKASYRWCDPEDRKIEETLKLFRAGKIVAWFQGAAEFGPRALGNRSLLASPWAPYVNENLNDYVKHRESFRPFALAVTAEDAAEYFECTPNSRFLTTMAVAKPKAAKLFEETSQGFLSRDNLVRLQVVANEDNPLLWKLLKSWGKNARAPMLVNTSFNLFGEPLVVTPRDAVRSYYCSGGDALVAGSFLLTKH